MNLRELADHLLVELSVDGRIDIIWIGMISVTALHYALHAFLDREKFLPFRYIVPKALKILHLWSGILA